ncbi:2-methylcitrate dehydratase PrpD [Azospirillum brasilense]|uniref:2-methylcitrate dehydratase PrpD n=1 Tax=Azospirillum brasilense TaxID=192 RepID=A0A560CDB6_AZOBR|nr:MmgE/PrpD family protein [Azospirillum brasilense]TWA82856.1 2-methylcitrate dehydratase PrpD [Azospirillum brasilense]
MGAPATGPSLTEELHGLLARPVTADDRRRAARHVLDWLACAVGGAATPAGTALRGQAALAGAGACTVVGVDGPAAPLDAAFINGGLGNILEMDDIHRTSILHPGPIVIPAALAAAQAFGRPAEAFLDAVVRGYEATIRIGRAAGTPHYARFHATATCGVFGAAAAVAALLGLDRAATVAALGNAGATAGGLWRCRLEPVMTKQWHNATAAQNGLRAAAAARAGLTGSRFVLEGAEGFFETLASGGGDPSLVLADPDAPWLLHETSIKPWPSCRHSHPTVDAALLARDAGIAAGDIDDLLVESYGDALRFCDRPEPATELEAKFSLQHVAAVCLASGPPALEDFRPQALDRAPVAALRRRVRVARSDALTAAYPEHYGATLTLTLTTGERRRFHVRDALGDPENPVSLDTLRGKALSLFAAGGLDPDRAADLTTRTLALGDGGSLADVAAGIPNR